MPLDAAHRAFDAGDFAEARRLARGLAATAPDEATRSAAAEILKRTAVDPVIVWVTAGSLAVFVVILVMTLWH
jgi:hypothetical protein